MGNSFKELKLATKEAKRAYKKSKRKHVTLWKTLAILSTIVTVVGFGVRTVSTLFDNTLAVFVGGTFTKYNNYDENAMYFTSDYDDVNTMIKEGHLLARQVEAEGATLLMNNGALPLAKGAKVSTLSTSSVDLVYGGTGSGNVDASTALSLKDCLESTSEELNVGLDVNDTLWNFYLNEAAGYRRSAGSGESAVLAGHASINEFPVDEFPQNVKDSIVEYGDAAIVTFSRVGGEGYDLEFDLTGKTQNYLALDESETNLLKYATELKKENKIKSLIVLLNTSNALQLDFLKNEEIEVDACLWIGGLGEAGTEAVADILVGNVNPSGSLADTYAYNNYTSPAMQNYTAVQYKGFDGKNIPSNTSTYMIYQEGIYVGYKYYETRYEDYVLEQGNAGAFKYNEEVAYTFGSGISYSNFKYTMGEVQETADQFIIPVTVENEGPYAGKETVQIYVQSPYTAYDVANKVEKASVSLVGFDKTDIIEVGKTETLEIKVDKRDLASYDAYGAKTYILESGNYYFTAATDAHNAINNILAKKGNTPASTNNRMDAEGNAELVYTWNAAFENGMDLTYAKSLNGTEITNQLSNADPTLYEGTKAQAEKANFTYLSRNDWTGTWPTESLVFTLNETLIKDLQEVHYNPADYEKVEMPKLGQKHGKTLYEMIGKDFNDPAWKLLLEQLTFEEMVTMIGDSFHWRMPVESVQAPGTRDENGPQGLTASLFNAERGELKATALTSEDVMAATFNVELIEKIGNLVGNNCLHANVACLYGPGANTHRTPYGGRNFEYYSEDGFLAGEMGGAEVKGIQDKGVDVVMKHFALNDSEQDRLGQAAWINEQAAREIYLKAFQKSLEESNGNGVMTAYTRWGTRWSGSHKGLMTGIMRGEWGNDGFSITDNVLVTYTNGVDAVMAGGVTTFDAMLWYVTDQLPNYKDDPVVVTAMVEAAHYNLYALANSSGMNGMGPETTIEVARLIIQDVADIMIVAGAILAIVSYVLWIVGSVKIKDERKAYKLAKCNLKTAKKAK